MIFDRIFDKLELEGRLREVPRIPSVDAILAVAYEVSRARREDESLRDPGVVDMLVSQPNLAALQRDVERYAEGRYGAPFARVRTQFLEYLSVQDGIVELRVLECPCNIGQHLTMVDLSDILYWESVGHPGRHFVWRILP